MARRVWTGDIHIGPIDVDRVKGRDRVTASIAGKTVFFESADVPLVPSVEAFASVFLLPALEHGVRLSFHTPPSTTWLDNARRIVELFRRWWGFGGPDPLEGIGGGSSGRTRLADGGQCFSGGIDSFFTLFHSSHRRDVLVFVHGLDIPLDDERRMRAYEPSLRTVAVRTGRRSVILRTSLRRHPLVRSVSWIREHGGALAAAGHVLSETIGSLVIPTSAARSWTGAWGSHWDSDPLWSSDRLQVIHDDPSLERWSKVPLLADEPLVFEHLRVCWENLQPTGNCGQCEKCLRTRIIFQRWGLLERIEPVFPGARPLVEALESLPSVTLDDLEWSWESDHAHWPLPGDVHQAIVRLNERSRTAQPLGPWMRMRRRLEKIGRQFRRMVVPPLR